MPGATNWYDITETADLDSPCLLIYPQRVAENTRLMKSLVPDVSMLRPHIKTAKIKEAVELMMKGGIQKFKAATIAEAELAAMCKAPDTLLAYQLNEARVKRFLQLVKRYPGTSFSCLVDNRQTTDLMQQYASQHRVSFRVYIDLNVGMNRTGINPGAEALSLHEHISQQPTLSFAGFHAYDGHIHETDMDNRTAECNEAFRPVELLREEVMKKDGVLPLLIAGGSPTFSIHAKRKNVECSPGTFIFWDKGYHDSLPEQHFQFAALVLTRIVSLPTKETVCVDLGHKAIASENELQRRVYFLNAPSVIPVSHSEEHMVLYAGKNHAYNVGDILYALPYHICPTVALHAEATCIESHQITGTWRVIARNRKINC